MAGTVIVLGGGVAGMSAAQELIERGFEVVVLERRDRVVDDVEGLPGGVDPGGLTDLLAQLELGVQVHRTAGVRDDQDPVHA